MVHAVKYSPVICGEISTRVVAIGQLGVWRCTQLDYILGDERAMDDMASEEYPFLPELHDFVVTEISQGTISVMQKSKSEGANEGLRRVIGSIDIAWS